MADPDNPGRTRWEAPEPSSDEKPYPIQRAETLKALRLLSWKFIRMVWETLRMEAKPAIRRLTDPREHGGGHWIEEARSEEELYRAFSEFRTHNIRAYRLEGLVPQNPDDFPRPPLEI